MTALDEAIAVVGSRWPHFDAEVILPVIIDMLGPNLLALLAIEQGGLVETDKKIVVGRDYQNGRYHNYFAPLYRMVEP